jgi:outer membrane receptor protein involved in Fe transport
MKPRVSAFGLLAHTCLAIGTATAAPTAAESDFEEIVVTARRQATAVLATPFSIGRVDADSVALVGATHSSEVLNRVPGALVQRGSGQESLTALRSSTR